MNRKTAGLKPAAGFVTGGRRGRFLIIGTFVMISLAVAWAGISVGTVSVGWNQLFGLTSGQSDQELSRQVLFNIRIPRVLTGALAGMDLAAAGVLLQGVLRNPLAAPQVIGVNAGAGFMAVVIMLLYPHQFRWLPLGAFLGALGAAAVIYLLAAKEQAHWTVNIILAGVAVSALFNALTSGLMILHSDDLDITYTWLIGGLTGRGWPHFQSLWPYSFAGLLTALALSPKLNLFRLGDEVGSSLGLDVKKYRLIFLLNAACLAGSAVSVCGTIGFIGLIAPHAARLLVGNDYRYLLVLSLLLGLCLLVGADTLARVLFQPVELPVGILTAALGTPFFLYLMYRPKNPV